MLLEKTDQLQKKMLDSQHHLSVDQKIELPTNQDFPVYCVDKRTITFLEFVISKTFSANFGLVRLSYSC